MEVKALSFSFTVLSKFKVLQLSKIGLSTIKHQHSKNLTLRADVSWTKNAWKCKLYEFVQKSVQNVHRHMPGDAFSAGQLQCR